jgi:hypothetical protein
MAKSDDDLFIIGLDLECTPTRLQNILNLNPKSWYDLVEKGTIPSSGTYKDYLLPLFNHYRKQNEIAAEKVKLKLEQTESKKSSRGESYEKLLEAQVIQKIRLDRAKEEGLYIANLKEKKEVLIKAELTELVEPVLRNIASILRAAGDEEPTLQPTIDKAFESLFKLGEMLAWQVEQDSKAFVQTMLDTPVDIEELLENKGDI